MGCDIHCYVEIRTGNSWEKVGKIFDHPWYNPKEPTRVDGDYEWNAKKTDSPYMGRNYELFGILAGVREPDFVRLADPRGLPRDVGMEVKRMSDGWGIDGHSHSYLTLRELLDFNWFQNGTEQWRIVSPEEYDRWKRTGKPDSRSKGVMGSLTRTVSNEEMEKIIKQGGEKGISYFTKVTWYETYKSCCVNFVTETIPALERLGDPEEVRIVFWFDN